MHPTTKGTVFFANRCNLNCDHCYVSPVFKEKIERMSPSVFAQALKFMNAAQIPIVTISGGEPMLYWSDLKKGLANNPIRTITVCTNGFWGVDKTSRKSILMELPEYGISELEISTDVYHQVFVSLEETNLRSAEQPVREKAISSVAPPNGQKQEHYVFSG